MIVFNFCRGELHSPSHDTGVFPYLWKQWHSLPLGHPTPSGFNVNSPLAPGFESGFSGFTGLQRTSSFLAQCLFIEDYFIPFFSPLRYASARGLALKAVFNNNLPNQTNDVMVNPENPDSKPHETVTIYK